MNVVGIVGMSAPVHSMSWALKPRFTLQCRQHIAPADQSDQNTVFDDRATAKGGLREQLGDIRQIVVRSYGVDLFGHMVSDESACFVEISGLDRNTYAVALSQYSEQTLIGIDHWQSGHVVLNKHVQRPHDLGLRSGSPHVS
jgi:hypothetical protein